MDQAQERSLAQSQEPFAFLMHNGGYRRDASGSVMLGLRYRTHCVGGCWALMVLLFVGGVMNLLLDRPTCAYRSIGEGPFYRPQVCSPCWHSPRRRGRVAVDNGNDLMAEPENVVAQHCPLESDRAEAMILWSRWLCPTPFRFRDPFYLVGVHQTSVAVPNFLS
jgi:hypothetical protein